MALDIMSFLIGKSLGGGSGGITGGYTVTFKVDGEDYYIASCQQSESITEPPVPTVETGKTFTGWKDGNGNVISFPYTPTTNIELTANIVNYNFLVSAGEIIGTVNNINYYLVDGRSNDICAITSVYRTVFPFNQQYTPIVISKTNSPNNMMTYTDSATRVASVQGNLTYNGTTYYYSSLGARDGEVSNPNNRYITSNIMPNYDASSYELVVTEILNAYFGATA